MFGSFVRDSDKRIVYTGTRSDKPALEDGHTFFDGLARPVTNEKFDDYKFVNGEIVTVKGAFMPTAEETVEAALPECGGDMFKKIVFNALYELAKKEQPKLTEEEYRSRLATFGQ